jgi:hypothetical protein
MIKFHGNWWQPEWLFCCADDDGGDDDGGGDDSAGADDDGATDGGDKGAAGSGDKGGGGAADGGGSADSAATDDDAAATDRANAKDDAREAAGLSDPGGGGTAARDPGTDPSDPTGSNQSPSGLSEGGQVGDQSFSERAGQMFSGGGGGGNEVTTDPNDPTGSNQSPTIESGFGTRVGGDVASALGTAGSTPAQDVSNLAGTIGQGGISSARDVLAGDTPVSQALSDANTPSNQTSFGSELSTLPGAFSGPGNDVFTSPAATTTQGPESFFDPAQQQPGVNDPFFAPGQQDPQGPVAPNDSITPPGQQPTAPDPNTPSGVPGNFAQAQPGNSFNVGNLLGISSAQAADLSPAVMSPQSQQSGTPANIFAGPTPTGDATFTTIPGALTPGQFSPGYTGTPPSDPVTESQLSNPSLTQQSPMDPSLVDKMFPVAGQQDSLIKPVDASALTPANLDPNVQPGWTTFSDHPAIQQPGNFNATPDANVPTPQDRPFATDPSATVDPSLLDPTLSKDQTPALTTNTFADTQQGLVTNTSPLDQQLAFDPAAMQAPASTLTGGQTPDTSPPTPAPTIADKGGQPAVTSPPDEGPGQTTTPDVLSALNDASGGGGTQLPSANAGIISPAQLIQPIPGAADGGTPSGGPLNPPVAPPFVPPVSPLLEDIGFGNINPEEGLFAPPGHPGGSTGVPGGVPGNMLDTLNNAVDTGAP